MSARRMMRVAILALVVTGCGIAVHADRATIGGGPEQATAQARAHIQATIVAAATANPQTGAAGDVCECETTGK
ncbi:MAG: hypothetical protein ACRDJN_00880 [Chloroflexota bacterium]